MDKTQDRRERRSVLIVGVGSIGERHLRCFSSLSGVEVWLCEVNAELRQTIAGRYQVRRVFDSLDAALAERPNAAVICTPAHLHVAMAHAAAQAKAHVLIEKPLSTTLHGVTALQTEIEKQKLVAGVAYTYRAHPALEAMRSALLDGRFGRPVQIVGVSGQCFPFYRPAYRNTYYKDRATGGGAVQDALTHIINAGEWLVGPVDRLVADLDHYIIADVTVEDTVHVLTRHGTAMGSFSLNQHQAPNESTLTVVCENGTARFEYHHCRWRWAIEPGGPWHDEPAQPLERDSLFTRQAQVFMNAVDGKGQPLCSLAEGLQTLRVNLGILTSTETQSWVAIQNSEAIHG